MDAAIAITIGTLFLSGLVAGFVVAWRNRPVRDKRDPEGEQRYLTAFNIANVKDFGAYKRYGRDD